MDWMDWIRKFFSDPKTVITMFSSALLGFVVGTANGVIQKRHGGWPAFWSAMVTGTVIAIIVGLALSEYIRSEALRCAIIGFCALISDDILAGFRTMGAGFRNNPLEALGRLIDALRGKPAPLPPAIPPVPKED